MQEHARHRHVREEPLSAASARISPLAVALTLGAAAFAVTLGITGPRLRGRDGSGPAYVRIGDLATIAAMHEARAAQDAAGGRARRDALAQLPALAQETVGRAAGADLEPAGWIPDDVRNVELAPGVHGTMVLYRHEDSDATLSVTMLPDDGRAAHPDGFGRTVPLAPGDEWLEAVADDAGSRAHVAYALADGQVLWLVLADRRSTLVPVAKLLK